MSSRIFFGIVLSLQRTVNRNPHAGAVTTERIVESTTIFAEKSASRPYLSASAAVTTAAGMAESSTAVPPTTLSTPASCRQSSTMPGIRNSLTKQYRKLLRQSGIEVHFDESALRSLAKRAIERKTGARGLRAEMEGLMKDIMFNAPENKEMGKVITITEDMVRNAA